jgi:hypothetical protein
LILVALAAQPKLTQKEKWRNLNQRLKSYCQIKSEHESKIHQLNQIIAFYSALNRKSPQFDPNFNIDFDWESFFYSAFEFDLTPTSEFQSYNGDYYDFQGQRFKPPELEELFELITKEEKEKQKMLYGESIEDDEDFRDSDSWLTHILTDIYYLNNHQQISQLQLNFITELGYQIHIYDFQSLQNRIRTKIKIYEPEAGDLDYPVEFGPVNQE